MARRTRGLAKELVYAVEGQGGTRAERVKVWLPASDMRALQCIRLTAHRDGLRGNPEREVCCPVALGKVLRRELGADAVVVPAEQSIVWRRDAGAELRALVLSADDLAEHGRSVLQVVVKNEYYEPLDEQHDLDTIEHAADALLALARLEAQQQCTHLVCHAEAQHEEDDDGGAGCPAPRGVHPARLEGSLMPTNVRHKGHHCPPHGSELELRGCRGLQMQPHLLLGVGQIGVPQSHQRAFDRHPARHSAPCHHDIVNLQEELVRSPHLHGRGHVQVDLGVPRLEDEGDAHQQACQYWHRLGTRDGGGNRPWHRDAALLI